MEKKSISAQLLALKNKAQDPVVKQMIQSVINHINKTKPSGEVENGIPPSTESKKIAWDVSKGLGDVIKRVIANIISDKFGDLFNGDS